VKQNGVKQYFTSRLLIRRRNGDGNAAAHGEFRREVAPSGRQDRHEIIEYPVGDVFVEGPLVAVGPEVEFQRLGLDDALLRRILNFDPGKIGLALGAMIDNLKQFRLAAHILDGPRGPAGRVKAGAIQLAHAAEAMMVPVYTAADRAWYFKSWDRFMLPKPFANVTLRFGRMIDYNALNFNDNFEQKRLELERTMLPGLMT
jgi:hypothetical protein